MTQCFLNLVKPGPFQKLNGRTSIDLAKCIVQRSGTAICLSTQINQCRRCARIGERILFDLCRLLFLVVPLLAFGMLVWVAAIIGLIRIYSLTVSVPLWVTCVVLFVLAWIGQFIGHKIEGQKPAFFEDLQFLLIGPLWLLSFVYQKLGFSY